MPGRQQEMIARDSLVIALSACARSGSQSKTRRFLSGLSCDELRYIAGFLGTSILESDRDHPCSRAQLAERIAEFQRVLPINPERPEDRDHKMLVLLEYLCRSGLQRFSTQAGVRSSRASAAQ
ncbi:MAG TPA: hypothetical protein VG675_21750 [Bryobacteraceae bacterium]|nr:hypothetical protein [Bryobacteraceae bacterium]